MHGRWYFDRVHILYIYFPWNSWILETPNSLKAPVNKGKPLSLEALNPWIFGILEIFSPWNPVSLGSIGPWTPFFPGGDGPLLVLEPFDHWSSLVIETPSLYTLRSRYILPLKPLDLERYTLWKPWSTCGDLSIPLKQVSPTSLFEPLEPLVH